MEDAVEDEKASKAPLVVSGSTNKPHDERPRWKSAWLTTVLVGVGVATFVLCANISLLIWTSGKTLSPHDSVTVFQSRCSCEKTKQISLWADLAINIASTALLSASGLCTNLLSSPTRRDIDNTHARGNYLNIGVPSVRNLYFLPRWRVVLWVSLLATSLPLHLLYNSVIYTTDAATDYQIAIVTESFVQGGWWNQTRALGSSFGVSTSGEVSYLLQPDIALFRSLQQNLQTLTRVDAKDCYTSYAGLKYKHQWRNGLVVVEATAVDNLLNIHGHFPDNIYDDYSWPCYGQKEDEFPDCSTSNSSDYSWPCYGKKEDEYPDCSTSNSFYWYTHGQQCQCHERVGDTDSQGNSVFFLSAMQADSYNTTSNRRWCEQDPTNCNLVDIEGQVWSPSYCYLEPGHDIDCTVEIDQWLLLVVIICNAIKIGCMMTMSVAHIWTKTFEPIATLGDAIASFLESPDGLTAHMGPISLDQVRESIKSKEALETSQARPLKNRERVWGHAWGLRMAGKRKIDRGILVAVAMLLTPLVFSLFLHNGQTISMNLGSINTMQMQRLGNAGFLLTNVPQLFVSLHAVLYNNLWINMFLTAEFAAFTSGRQYLRVSKPRGGQNSTYWLSMPFTFAAPIMAIMAIIHWMVSRAVSYYRIGIWDHSGTLQPSRTLSEIGFSRFPVAIAILLVLLLWSVLLWGAFLKRSDNRAPLVCSCSIAIAAACNHAGLDGAAMLRLKYGAIKQQGRERQERPFAGFSSRKVEPLQFDVLYT